MSTMIVAEGCINCGVCVRVCPNDGIYPGEKHVTLDASLCTECVGFYPSQECAEVCPTNCLIPDPDDRGTEEALFARAVAIHAERDDMNPVLTNRTSHFRTAPKWWERLLPKRESA